MPIYETGHARNIQNFQTMISFVTAYGAAYDPTNPDLAVANLTGRLTAANGAMDDVASTLAANKSAINTRENFLCAASKARHACRQFLCFDRSGGKQDR